MVRRQAGPARFLVADATRLPLRPAMADAVVSALLLNFLPVPAAGVGEMARLARPGGFVAAYVWDYAGRMELLRIFWDAAVELDPAAEPLDEARRFPLCRPEVLEQVWRDAGLADVQASGIQVATTFQDFDDYWRPFLGGQGPAPAYVASLEAPRREALRETLRAFAGGHAPTVAAPDPTAGDVLPMTLDAAVRVDAAVWAVGGAIGLADAHDRASEASTLLAGLGTGIDLVPVVNDLWSTALAKVPEPYNDASCDLVPQIVALSGDGYVDKLTCCSLPTWPRTT